MNDYIPLQNEKQSKKQECRKFTNHKQNVFIYQQQKPMVSILSKYHVYVNTYLSLWQVARWDVIMLHNECELCHYVIMSTSLLFLLGIKKSAN